MKNKYFIPVSWEMSGLIEVEADSLQDAYDDLQANSDHHKLPEGSYVDSSFRVDEMDIEDIAAIYNGGKM